MKKILAGGDSYLDQGCDSYKGQNIKFWPEYFDDASVVVIGGSGASNDWILNTTFDAIQVHKPDLVICQWSQSMRLSFHNKHISVGFDKNDNFYSTGSGALKNVGERVYFDSEHFHVDVLINHMLRRIKMANTFHENVFHVFGPNFFNHTHFKEEMNVVKKPGQTISRLVYEHMLQNMPEAFSPIVQTRDFMFSQENFLKLQRDYDKLMIGNYPITYPDNLRKGNADVHPSNEGHYLTYKYFNKYIRMLYD